MKIAAAVFLFILCAALPAFAAKKPAADKSAGPQLIGTYGNWRAWRMTEQDQPVCYMTITAHFPKKPKFQRGDALLTITHRPAESSTDVFSYASGYNYKPGSSVTLHIGKSGFDLFTAQNTAWSRDAITDHKIAATIRTAPSLMISGIPAQKDLTPVTDKFTLTGAAEAYRDIGKACGIESDEKPAPKAKPKKVKKKNP